MNVTITIDERTHDLEVGYDIDAEMWYATAHLDTGHWVGNEEFYSSMEQALIEGLASIARSHITSDT